MLLRVESGKGVAVVGNTCDGHRLAMCGKNSSWCVGRLTRVEHKVRQGQVREALDFDITRVERRVEGVYNTLFLGGALYREDSLGPGEIGPRAEGDDQSVIEAAGGLGFELEGEGAVAAKVEFRGDDVAVGLEAATAATLTYELAGPARLLGIVVESLRNFGGIGSQVGTRLELGE